jgi:hypothetical protein
VKSIKGFLVFTFFILYLPHNAESNIADSSWPMLQHDMFHAGQGAFEGPEITRATVKFKKDIAAGASSPVIDSDGTVYIGANDFCVYAVWGLFSGEEIT